MAVQIGQQAPDFTLYDTGKNAVTLSDYKGKTVLLLFFPFAFSRVCTSELCTVRDSMSMYGDGKAVVMGISVDSLYTLARFKTDENFSFLLLSDFNKEVSALYGALHEQFSYGMKGVSKRAAFIIDGEGFIRYAEVLENPGQLPNFELISKSLTEIA
jgi:glutaredoxin-dependent peroxiredoxin